MAWLTHACQIFLDEINIVGSFSQTHCFPRAVAYLDSKKVIYSLSKNWAGR